MIACHSSGKSCSSAAASSAVAEVVVKKPKRVATPAQRHTLGLWRQVVKEVSGKTDVLKKGSELHAKAKEIYGPRLAAAKADNFASFSDQ